MAAHERPDDALSAPDVRTRDSLRRLSTSELQRLERDPRLPVERWRLIVDELHQRNTADRVVRRCVACGYVGAPVRRHPGTGWITLVLVIFYVIPAIVYELWRGSAAYDACPRCGGRETMRAAEAGSGLPAATN